MPIRIPQPVGRAMILINGNKVTRSQTPLQQYNSKVWKGLEKLPYKVQENQMMLKIPNHYLGSDFDFNWIDNPEKLKNINDFFGAGDNEPSRRTNYRYSK